MRRWIIAGLLLVALIGGLRWASSAWRRYLISRCPIAYVGIDKHIHLTNPEGTIDVEMEGATVDISYCPTWSPSGSMLAYMHRATDEMLSIIVLEPLEARRWEHRCKGRLAGWLDEKTFFETQVGGRDARTGEVVRGLSSHCFGSGVRHVCPVPGGGDSVVSLDGGAGILEHRRAELFEKRLLTGRFEFRWVSRGDVAQGPRIDLTGKWVGWTPNVRREHDPYRMYGIAIKPLTASMDDPWIWLGEDFGDAVFCDWTDDGKILARVRDKPPPGQWWPTREWRLVFIDKDGALPRGIPTDVRPNDSAGAAWRKNMLGGK